jgi:hypothetical protein
MNPNEHCHNRGVMLGFARLTPTVMPIHLGAPMDENPPGAEPIVIFTATYAGFIN